MPLPRATLVPNAGAGGSGSHIGGGVVDAAAAVMSAAASSTKGNDGRRSRQRFLIRVSLWLILGLFGYRALWTYYLAGVNIPDYEIDKVTGQKRIRRRPEHLVKYDHIQQKDVPTDPFDAIMEGYLTLVNIVIPNKGLISSETQAYTDVKGQFCSLSWTPQQTNPASVPMFKDLKDASPLCMGTMHSVDLYEVTRKAMDYDHRNHTFVATKPRDGQGPVPPTAVVFHETRCGSTLIANLLAAFKPKHTRVYSESPPPVAALRACMDNRQQQCDKGAHVQLIRDVFYMMGRITRVEQPQYVFYKIQSIGSHAIHAFTTAMPDTPWMFVYRDSVEIMMSHFKNFQHGHPLNQDFYPVCLRTFGQLNIGDINPVMKDLVAKQGTTIEALSKEEFCAAHIASLAESAVREHHTLQGTVDAVEKKTPHWFINYEQLPHIIWEKILPVLLGTRTLEKDMITRMQKIGHHYSKGRGPKAGQTWKEDKTLKQGKAPEVVRNAAKKFLDPVYERMELIRKKSEL